MKYGLEIGQYLARLREKAGLKQNELANRITWSPAVLSRVESGERAVSADELECILGAIGTEEATQFADTAGRVWEILPKPPLGHSDEQLLWNAEKTLQKVKELSDSPDIKNVFVKRLDEFMEELGSTASLVLQTEYSIAFVGDIGVGKSTAICRVTDLEIKQKEKITPVLEVGGGGVTVCDVHLINGPEYGIVVEPMSENEIRREVFEFAQFVKQPQASHQVNETEGIDTHGTSKEIERAVRNMSGLTRRRVRKEIASGARTSRITLDAAKDLADKCTDPGAFAVEILAKMDLQRRTRREIWYSEASGDDPLVWLKENFELVNNGRHPEFSIPERFEITVPKGLFDQESLSIRFVDTKGIDRTAERRDLEEHFSASNTIVILCSTFNDAPSQSLQQLLERAKNARLGRLEDKASILVLPRPEEALAVKDDEGFKAESTEDGYELKRDQIDIRLTGLYIRDLQTEFFNVFEDPTERLRGFLLNSIESLRQRQRDDLKKAIDDTNYLLEHHELEQTLEIQRRAARHLIIWLKKNQSIGSFGEHYQASLLAAIRKVHPSSLRASVRRRGEWYNLDYSHQLGYGARKIAVGVVGPKFEDFKAVTKNLLQDTEYEAAFGLLRQARRIIESGTETLFKKAQILGSTFHTTCLQPDTEIWDRCDSEWGKGSGYRDRVWINHKNWFVFHLDSMAKQTPAIVELVEQEWNDIIRRLRAILEDEV